MNGPTVNGRRPRHGGPTSAGPPPQLPGHDALRAARLPEGGTAVNGAAVKGAAVKGAAVNERRVELAEEGRPWHDGPGERIRQNK